MSFSSVRGRLFKAAEKRRFPRVADRPLFVKIDGRSYRVQDWSLGGFQLRNYPRPVAVGSRISGEIRAADGVAAEAQFTAEVTWVGRGGQIGVSIRTLDDSAFAGGDPEPAKATSETPPEAG